MRSRFERRSPMEVPRVERRVPDIAPTAQSAVGPKDPGPARTVDRRRPLPFRDSVPSPARSVEVVAQNLRPGRVAELRHGLRLDLADALAGDAVNLADLVEGAGLAVGQAEPQPHDAGLAL